MLKWSSLLAVTLLLSGTEVYAQDSHMQQVRQAFPAETVAEIEGILATAQAAGVPTDPLINKALEGAAKGVPGDRVVVALSAYYERLQETRTLIGSERGVPSLVAGADALRRGVPNRLVGDLARGHSGDLAVPLVVLGDLIVAGVAADQAYAIVENALEEGHAFEEMLAIPGAVEHLMRQGHSATEAAGMVGSAIGSGQFGAMGQQGRAMSRPPQGAPVPPGSGPPDSRDKGGEKGKGKGNSGGGG